MHTPLFFGTFYQSLPLLLTNPHPRVNIENDSSPLRHKSHSIIKCRRVGGRAEVEMVGDRAGGVGNYEQVGEVVGVASASRAGTALQRVGLGSNRFPSY